MNIGFMRLGQVISLLSIALVSFAEFIVEHIEQALDFALSLHQPTTEDALREINATGHANKNIDFKVLSMPDRQMRNSAKRHVSMLKSIGGEALAA